MPRRTLALLALLIPLVSLSIAPLVVVQAAAYALLASSILPDSGNVKFPQVAAYGGTVGASGNANRRDAYLWEKAATAGSFGGPAWMGMAEGQPDYSVTHLVYSPNGSLFYLWANSDQRRIYMRVRPAGASEFGPTTPVLISPGLPSHFDAVARSDGEVFMFYREFFNDSFVPLRYVVIGVVGNTSAPVAGGTIESGVLQPGLRAAAGSNGEVAVGYTLADGVDGRYQAHVATWENGTWVRANVSERNGEYGDPMPTITPDGKYFVTYRGISEGTDGTYYSERQPDGTWPIARLQKGETKWSSMVADPYGNLHLFYLNYISGGPRLYYVVKPAGQPFEPVFDVGEGNYFNVDGNISVSDRIYGHAVVEDFSGTRPEARYFLMRSDLVGVDASAIRIAGGQPYSDNGTVTVNFDGVTGDQSAMQVRYRWGEPPTDADPWRTFTNPLTVDAPALADPQACSEQILFTQLRSGSAIQQTPNQDSVIFDTTAQAIVQLVNPNSTYDPTFTATPRALLKIDSWSECIGLSGGTVSGNITPASQSLAINQTQAFQKTLDLAGAAGLKTITVNVADLLGNTTGNLQRRITYDPIKPVQTLTGTVTITPDLTNPVTNIFAAVEIDAAVVTDTGGLYGLLIESAFTPTSGSPVSGTTPTVVPFSAMRAVTQSNGTVSLTFNWNLLNGIPPDKLGPGAYSFKAYFVDRAGNRADQVALQSDPITLTTIRPLKVALPLVRR